MGRSGLVTRSGYSVENDHALPAEDDCRAVGRGQRGRLTGVPVARGDELKLVFPQSGAEPARFEGLDFAHFFLQPMDGPARGRNTAEAVAYCLAHPRWRLSLQTHKILGIR